MLKDWLPFVTIAVTAVLFLLHHFYIDPKKEKIKAKKQLQESQLKDLYNKLYVYYLKHDEELDVHIKEEPIETDEGVVYTHRELDFNNLEVLQTVISDVLELVYGNIHLLTYEDLKSLNNFKNAYSKEPESNEDLFDMYSGFRPFVRQTVQTYKSLYSEYHGMSSEIEEDLRIDKINKLKQMKLDAEMRLVGENKRKKVREYKKRIRRVKLSKYFKQLRE